MEEPCTCPRGPSRCTAWASHTSHRLRSDQCVSARRNVKRGIGALTPARSSSPRLDAVLVAPLLIGIAAVATVLIARTWLAETDEVVGLARGPVAVRAFVSGGSARPDKVLGSAPRLGLQVILSRSSPWYQCKSRGQAVAKEMLYSRARSRPCQLLLLWPGLPPAAALPRLSPSQDARPACRSWPRRRTK